MKSYISLYLFTFICFPRLILFLDCISVNNLFIISATVCCVWLCCSFVSLDSACNSKVTTGNIIRLFLEDKVDAFVGPPCSVGETNTVMWWYYAVIRGYNSLVSSTQQVSTSTSTSTSTWHTSTSTSTSTELILSALATRYATQSNRRSLSQI